MTQPQSESEILASVYENVRHLTKFYIAKSRTMDPFIRYEVNGRLLNSRYWLLAHLVWTEHTLLIKGLTNTELDIPWLSRFQIGSEPVESDDLPSMEVVLETLDRVHDAAVAAIRSLSVEDLNSENHWGKAFRNDRSKRMIIHHAIRHEPCHTGQLGWLCKISGVETI